MCFCLWENPRKTRARCLRSTTTPQLPQSIRNVFPKETTEYTYLPICSAIVLSNQTIVYIHLGQQCLQHGPNFSYRLPSCSAQASLWESFRYSISSLSYAAVVHVETTVEGFLEGALLISSYMLSHFFAITFFLPVLRRSQLFHFTAQLLPLLCRLKPTLRGS